MTAVLAAGLLSIGLNGPATAGTAHVAKVTCGTRDCIWSGWGTSVVAWQADVLPGCPPEEQSDDATG
jgi:hypothetical protein